MLSYIAMWLAIRQLIRSVVLEVMIITVIIVTVHLHTSIILLYGDLCCSDNFNSLITEMLLFVAT